MMTGTYEIIYADPPWRYSAKKVQGAAENHYTTMSIDELCALPVAELAAKDSALFMWATFPQLPEALRLIRAWGFTYKSVAFVWLKKNKKADSWFYGLGFWTRANAEVCLLATKGKPKRISAGVGQLVFSPLRRHSQKLDELKEVAARYGVDASAMRKKADVIAAIEATKAEQPDDGADDEEPPQIGAADPV